LYNPVKYTDPSGYLPESEDDIPLEDYGENQDMYTCAEDPNCDPIVFGFDDIADAESFLELIDAFIDIYSHGYTTDSELFISLLVEFVVGQLGGKALDSFVNGLGLDKFGVFMLEQVGGYLVEGGSNLLADALMEMDHDEYVAMVYFRDMLSDAIQTWYTLDPDYDWGLSIDIDHRRFDNDTFMMQITAMPDLDNNGVGDYPPITRFREGHMVNGPLQSFAGTFNDFGDVMQDVHDIYYP
jgi:hypothetical protein